MKFKSVYPGKVFDVGDNVLQYDAPVTKPSYAAWKFMLKVHPQRATKQLMLVSFPSRESSAEVELGLEV